MGRTLKKYNLFRILVPCYCKRLFSEQKQAIAKRLNSLLGVMLICLLMLLNDDLASREHVLREITPYNVVSSTSAVAWQRKAVLKFIPLKQLEEMHVADESILYSLFAALSDKQVFPCLLRVSQGEMILSHQKCLCSQFPSFKYKLIEC